MQFSATPAPTVTIVLPQLSFGLTVRPHTTPHPKKERNSRRLKSRVDEFICSRSSYCRSIPGPNFARWIVEGPFCVFRTTLEVVMTNSYWDLDARGFANREC